MMYLFSSLMIFTLISFPSEFSKSMLPRPRRLLLLVNPYSGRGQAMQWCQTHILPMIREANISYNLIQTGMNNTDYSIHVASALNLDLNNSYPHNVEF